MLGLCAVVAQRFPGFFEEDDGLVDNEDRIVDDALQHLMQDLLDIVGIIPHAAHSHKPVQHQLQLVALADCDDCALGGFGDLVYEELAVSFRLMR